MMLCHNNKFKFNHLNNLIKNYMSSDQASIPDYVPLALKGTGAFGYVIEAYDRKKDIRVAIKRTHKVGTKLSREYEILSEIKECPFVVKLLEVFYTTNDDKKVIQNLVFEFVPNSLEKFMENYKLKKKFIPVDKIKIISKQILMGLNYCHNKNIVHRDLKPDNILMTEDEQIKICDFGSSKSIIKRNNLNKNESKSTPYVVTRYYRAPELFFGKSNYDTKIDIFSAGCIIAELFILNALFPGSNEGLQIFEYMNILGVPDQNYLKEFNLNQTILDTIKSFENINVYPLEEIINPKNFYNKKDIDEACDLIYNMLNWDYNKRFTAEQCLQHPFLKDVKIKKKNINKNFEFKIINK